ncbi:MAG TPA: N-acetyltransferase [Verrucomicrobiae bacterium]|nr:N-acetyltransferase [Verrucomicrobiae bacterium]
MSSPLEIIALTRQPRDVRRFFKLAYRIYDGDPRWFAPLLMDMHKVFADANPLFTHAEMQLWVARRDGRDVGRIAGVIDRNHNAFHQERTAFFGFFECVDDAAASAKLFEAVAAWAKQKGMDRLLGPMNPTTNDECGLLVDGFETPPVFMMTYNPRYYVKLLEGAGFRRAKDLLAFEFAVAGSPQERLKRFQEKFRKREPDLRIVPLAKKTLKEQLVKVKAVYNQAWEKNWGFVPMTDAEIDFMAERLKPLLTDGLAFLAETPQEPVGFMLAMPDFNEAFLPLRGRLLSPGLLRAVPYLLGWKAPRYVRCVTLGVTAKARGRGIEAAMLAEGVFTSLRLGIQRCEASWILEDNVPVIRMIELFGGKVYKTYRIYERPA